MHVISATERNSCSRLADQAGMKAGAPNLKKTHRHGHKLNWKLVLHQALRRKNRTLGYVT